MHIQPVTGWLTRATSFLVLLSKYMAMWHEGQRRTHDELNHPYNRSTTHIYTHICIYIILIRAGSVPFDETVVRNYFQVDYTLIG